MDQDILYRTGTIYRDVVDEDSRTIELSFSSDSPVERHFGNEVLEHSEDAVDLERLNNSAPLLLEHDRGQQIGVVERAWVDKEDKKGRAVVRFSKSALGQEIFQDVRDGIRSLVSVGYQVGRFVTEKAEEGLDTFRAVSWQPLEISLVSVPADASVGVGRSTEESSAPQPKETNMEENNQVREEAPEVVERKPEPEVRIEVRPDKRANEIAELGKRFNASSDAVDFIAEGKSANDFKEFIMERNATQPIEDVQGDDKIGMSEKECRRYSLTDAIMKSAEGKLDGIELEASRELEKRFGKPAQGFYMPNDVMQRDLTATQSDTGDKLVAEVKPSMIEALIAQPIVAQLGARVLSGLSSNVVIPKAGATAAYWSDEIDSGSAVSESTPTLGSISLSPKRVAGYSEYSKQLLAQSSFDVENMIKDDLAKRLNLAFDKVAIDGGGTNEPSGVLDASGLHGQTGGQTWQNMVDAEADVLSTNALAGALAYVSTPANMAAMKATDVGTDTGQFVWANNQINGYPAVATNQMTSATTVFGDWSQVILAEFGSGVDVVVDGFTLALTGMIRVHVSRLVDVGVRHGAAFCKITA